MQIKLNDTLTEVDTDTTVERLVGERTAGTAVAINNRFIPRTSWSSTTVHEGDDVVIISAAYGG